MPLPQDISPINSEMMDSIARSAAMDWIETKPGKAFMKILWIVDWSRRRTSFYNGKVFQFFNLPMLRYISNPLNITVLHLSIGVETFNDTLINQ